MRFVCSEEVISLLVLLRHFLKEGGPNAQRESTFRKLVGRTRLAVVIF